MTKRLLYICIPFCYRSVNYNTPRQVIVTLPDEARTSVVQLSWWQITEMQTGAFAIDNVLIGPSTYDFGSTYNDTYVVIHCYNHCCEVFELYCGH